MEWVNNPKISVNIDEPNFETGTRDLLNMEQE
jgi:hypothetical protein